VTSSLVFGLMEPKLAICRTRREFLSGAAISVLTGTLASCQAAEARPVVSVVRIRKGNIEAAVEEAIELLGGMAAITRGKERIMLKPNLVAPIPEATTKLPVMRALVRLMRSAHKDISIGEGSAAAAPFNVRNDQTFRTSNKDLLNGLQRRVFDELGYSEFSKTEKVPLVNLHTGDLVDVSVPNALLFDKLTLHRSLTEIDLLCSVPMMKTHVLAGVTLGMKNLIGLYPGAIYQALRGNMHDMASKDRALRYSGADRGHGAREQARPGGDRWLFGNGRKRSDRWNPGSHGDHHRRHESAGHRYGGGEPHGLRARRDFDLHVGAQGRAPTTPPGGDRDSRRTARSRPARVRSACSGSLEPRRRPTAAVIDSSTDGHHGGEPPRGRVVAAADWYVMFKSMLIFALLAVPLAAAQRTTLSLDGQWEIADSVAADALPAAYTHRAPVPGLAHSAVPAFKDVDQFESRQLLQNRVSRGLAPASALVSTAGVSHQERNWFWYRRRFQVAALRSVATLRINKAQFGAAVWVNGEKVGEHLPCFSAAIIDVSGKLRQGENEIVVRVGAHPGVLPASVSAGTDFEKNRWTPGIYDSVSLALSGDPAIESIQVAPSRDLRSIAVQTKLRNHGAQPVAFALTQAVHAWKSVVPLASAPPLRLKLAAGETRTVTQTIAMPGAKLWTPEEPNLYVLETGTGGDSTSHALRHARVPLRDRDQARLSQRTPLLHARLQHHAASLLRRSQIGRAAVGRKVGAQAACGDPQTDALEFLPLLHRPGARPVAGDRR
jgi:uncharacterized protein (DUF362 family)